MLPHTHTRLTTCALANSTGGNAPMRHFWSFLWGTNKVMNPGLPWNVWRGVRPVHTGRKGRFAHSFAWKPFDVAYKLYEHHHWPQCVCVPLFVQRGAPRPVWTGSKSVTYLARGGCRGDAFPLVVLCDDEDDQDDQDDQHDASEDAPDDQWYPVRSIVIWIMKTRLCHSLLQQTNWKDPKFWIPLELPFRWKSPAECEFCLDKCCDFYKAE